MVRWTSGEYQVKFRWSLKSPVRVKSQRYSELDIGGCETCMFSLLSPSLWWSHCIADSVTNLALAGQSQHEILMPGMIFCPWTLGIVHRDSGGLLTFWLSKEFVCNISVLAATQWSRSQSQSQSCILCGTIVCHERHLISVFMTQFTRILFHLAAAEFWPQKSRRAHNISN